MDLALFVNASTVASIEPKNSFGVDLVAELRKCINGSNHTINSVATLIEFYKGLKIETNVLNHTICNRTILEYSGLENKFSVIMGVRRISVRGVLNEKYQTSILAEH